MIYHERILETWQYYLPMVQRIMNAKEHEVTKVAPAKLMFGPAIDLDTMLYPEETEEGMLSNKRRRAEENVAIENPLETSKKKRKINIPLNKNQLKERLNSIDKIYIAQEELLMFAKTNQQKYDDLMFQKRSGKPITEFAIGSYVFVEYPASRYSSAPTKFHSKWRGPLKVVKEEINSRYLVKDLVTSKEELVHVTNLKNFLYEEIEVDPNIIALGDVREWVIEEIIEHLGSMKNGAKVSELQFKVRWAGLQEKYDRWLPWKELRLSTQLHAYLRKINKPQLIPKNLENTGEEEKE
jgi:hypothetical protein